MKALGVTAGRNHGAYFVPGRSRGCWMKLRRKQGLQKTRIDKVRQRKRIMQHLLRHSFS